MHLHIQIYTCTYLIDNSKTTLNFFCTYFRNTIDIVLPDYFKMITSYVLKHLNHNYVVCVDYCKPECQESWNCFCVFEGKALDRPVLVGIVQSPVTYAMYWLRQTSASEHPRGVCNHLQYDDRRHVLRSLYCLQYQRYSADRLTQ